MHAQDKCEGDARPDSPGKVVPLILDDAHREALRENCLSALHGVLGDLKNPDRLSDPVATAREGEVFRRLVEALFDEQITVPDEEMREQMQRLSENYDQAENADEILAAHDAHQELLAVLDGSEDAEAGGSPGPGWIPGDDADCRREVLDLLLHEAPDYMDFDEVAIALAGDSENRAERNTLREAVQALVAAGLARRQGRALAPTRSARQMAELGFSIG
jgi:hypothetical protein